MVPEGWLPKRPNVVDPDIAQDDGRLKNKQIKKGHGNNAKSDIVEKAAYYCLRNYFEGGEDVVLVIHGIEMHNIGEDKGHDKQEIDFLVVNYTKQYILNLEAKTALTYDSVHNGIWTIIQEGKDKGKEKYTKPAKEQLHKIRGLIQNWFKADL